MSDNDIIDYGSPPVAGKLGMSSFRKQDVPLRLGNYFNETRLPDLPRGGFGHFSAAGPCSGMLANDRYACCVMAGAAHEDQLWHWAAKRPVPRYDDRTIIEQYLEASGGKDEGLDPVAVAERRQNKGLRDADGNYHTVKGFALIDSHEEMLMGTRLFGATGAGLWLPQDAEAQFEAGHIWDSLRYPRDENRGHYVVSLGRNSKGLTVFFTWGRLQAATEPWVRKYYVGGLAYFSPHYLTVDGVSPEAINEAQLDADLRAVPNIRHV